MKAFRKVYENKINNANGFIPTEEQFTEYEKDIRIETKDQDGCKIEFILKNNVLIGALITDELLNAEQQKMNEKNYILAYNDFDKFLNS